MTETQPQVEAYQEPSMEAEAEAFLRSKGVLVETPSSQEASVTPEGGEHAPPTEAKPDEAKAGESESEPEKKGKTREEKSEERKAKTWEQVNAEKEEVRRLKAEAEREKAEAERLRLEAEERAKTAGEFKPEDYERAAEGFEAEGDTENAKRAREKARQLRTDAEAAKLREQRQKLEREYRAAVESIRKELPELDDPENPLRKRTDEILNAKPELKGYPNGVVDAVRFAQMSLRAEQAESLEKQVNELKAKLEDREKRLQPGESVPTPERAGKNFFQLSTEEQRAMILSAARAADDSGVGIEVLNFRS